MTAFEARTTRVSFYGGLADATTRRSVPRSAFQLSLSEGGTSPVCKENGLFAFADLRPKASPYSITVGGHAYRARRIEASLPTPDPVAVTGDGEDELYVSVTTVELATQRVGFDRIPFLPTIDAGAEVVGPGGFSATLGERLEGEDVDFAVLSTVAGLTPGDVLRIVRSNRLLLRPGPYYTFPEPATILSARFHDDTSAAYSIAGARLALDQVNGVATTTVTVGGVVLHRVQIGGSSVVLGPASAVETHSNPRGEALLDFPAHLAITSLRLQVSCPGYVPIAQTVAVTAGEVTRWTQPLVPA
jgi:hypothetical protein